MENMITMANDAGATVHNIDEHNAVIIFSEAQLMAFMYLVETEVKQDLIIKLHGG
jgi:hypothetical protein